MTSLLQKCAIGKRPIKPLRLLIICGLLGGCQHPSAPTGVPAILAPAEDNETTHPFSDIISFMLNGASVTLAADAFYNNHEVIIEPPKLGRSFERPDHFRLWLVDGHCQLEHVESKRQLVIAGASCLPATP
ncbi:hypothetical protein KFE80_02955 [bacterium SCSIO 12696]|nr:hypothetical protein KFE80_02955 [bacterium SCSIO 12696]